ncbi:hypothetical protein BH11MYX1_BH11MYX1_14380 [soil metagenome]
MARQTGVWLAVLALVGCQRDKPKGGGDCVIVVERVQAGMETQVDKIGSDAREVIKAMIPAMQTSCVEDKWPSELTQCIVKAKPGDVDALTKCNSMMSKSLQDKLQTRLMALQPAPKRSTTAPSPQVKVP